MYTELIVKTQFHEHKIFLQNGFFHQLNHQAINLHKHNFAEVHVIANGNATFSINEHSYSLNSGDLIIIPRDIFHFLSINDENTMHTAFQIDYDQNEISIYNIGTDTILNFFDEIKKLKFSQDYSKIMSYIAFFCGYFYHNEVGIANYTNDYGFLIYEFFSTRYNMDLHLCDLADFLHVSERQAERLVIKHTGNTFKKELVSLRMAIANNLLKYTDMTLKEVALSVGYSSYAGFWKARNKYNL